MMKFRHAFSALLVLGVATTSLHSTAQAQISGTMSLLKGTVVSTEGSVVPNISIAILKGTERITTTKSTSEGKFQAVLKPGATYRITYTSDNFGYREDTLVIPQIEKYQEFPLHATLIPIREGQPFTPATPVFLPSSTRIEGSALAQLENIVNLIKHNPKLTVNVLVHPDAPIRTKKDADQQKLVDARATAIRSFFLSKSLTARNVNIATSAIVPEGRFPGSAPAAPSNPKKKGAATTSSLIPAYVEIVAHIES